MRCVVRGTWVKSWLYHVSFLSVSLIFVVLSFLKCEKMGTLQWFWWSYNKSIFVKTPRLMPVTCRFSFFSFLLHVDSVFLFLFSLQSFLPWETVLNIAVSYFFLNKIHMWRVFRLSSQSWGNLNSSGEWRGFAITFHLVVTICSVDKY